MSKVHTTNYFGTFIAVAEDCSTPMGLVPPEKPVPTVAWLQFQRLWDQGYRWTSDEVLFGVAATKNGWTDAERDQRWSEFFSQGQACFRASPLTKTYGWGVHFDAQGKMALVGRGSPEYERLVNDPTLVHVKAMRTSR